MINLRRPRLGWALGLVLSACLSACYPDPVVLTPLADDAGIIWPEHYPKLTLADDQRLTTERLALGKRLFFDPKLSRDGTIACASCHKPELAFTDGLAVSQGIDGRTVTRNSPSVANLAWATSLFWDGGVPTLDLQVLAPIENVNEMDNNVTAVVAMLNADPSYVTQFQAAYGRTPDAYGLTRAIAAFERSLISATSPYDLFITGRNPAALSASARRGLELFNGERAECFHCHSSNLFSDFTFQNNGLSATFSDPGRARVTQLTEDIGRFKVPSLRNVALTAPYMHDGSLPTLEAVLAHYESGGHHPVGQSPLVRPFALSPQDRQDIVAFLNALTDATFVNDPRHRP